MKDFIYQTVRLELKKCEPLGVVSKPGESAEEFQHALVRAATEKQQAELKVLEEAHEREVERLTDEKLRAPSAFWLGMKRAGSAIGAFLLRLVVILPELIFRIANFYLNKGSRLRKPITARQLDQLSRAAKGPKNGGKDEPVERTKSEIEAEIDAVSEKFLRDKDELEKKYDPTKQPIAQITAQPRKADIDVNEVQILWLPHERRGESAKAVYVFTAASPDAE